MVEIGGLWKKQGEKGVFLVGAFGNATIFAFKNEYKKEGDNQPDYKLFVAPSKEKKPKPQQQDNRHNDI